MSELYIKAEAAMTQEMLQKKRSVDILSEVDSTNDYLLSLLKDGRYQRAVIAHRQTGGRGRLGRSFYSPEGGLYISLDTEIPGDDEKFFRLLTPAAGVATARAISETTGIDVGLKWVNDIELDGKKLGGILAQSTVCPDGARRAVVGIGINVNITSFPDEISSRATSLLLHQPDREFNINELAVAIINSFDHYMSLFYAGDKGVIDSYRSLLTTIGCAITVIPAEDAPRFSARALDVADDGSLIILCDNGIRRLLDSGEVSIRTN